MAYSLPADIAQRPVAIDSTGTLGRRIAAVYVAGGSDVRLFDASPEQRKAARRYVEENIAEVQHALDLRPDRIGQVEVASERSQAVNGAWLVIEAVPERIDVKTAVFGELDEAAEPDAILATNSSSLPSRLIIDNVQHPERVLNMHYYRLPEMNVVELPGRRVLRRPLALAPSQQAPQLRIWRMRRALLLEFRRINGHPRSGVSIGATTGIRNGVVVHVGPL